MSIFSVNVQIESMEYDGNSIDEIDNEFGEELNDEWGLTMGIRLKKVRNKVARDKVPAISFSELYLCLISRFLKSVFRYY